MEFYPVAIEKLIEEFAKLPSIEKKKISSKINFTYFKFAKG